MKTNYKIVAFLFFYSLVFHNTFGQIALKKDENITITSDQFSTSASIANDANLTVKSNAILTIGSSDTPGNFEIKNGGKISVENGSTIIIFGDLILNNDAKLNIDGRVIVYGNIYLKNSALVSGSGVLEYKKTIDLKNDAKITVTQVYNPNVITATSSNENQNELVSIYVYSINGNLLKSFENTDKSQLILESHPEFNNQKIVLLKIKTPSKVYTEKRFINN